MEISYNKLWKLLIDIRYEQDGLALSGTFKFGNDGETRKK